MVLAVSGYPGLQEIRLRQADAQVLTHSHIHSAARCPGKIGFRQAQASRSNRKTSTPKQGMRKWCHSGIIRKAHRRPKHKRI